MLPSLQAAQTLKAACGRFLANQLPSTVPVAMDIGVGLSEGPSTPEGQQDRWGVSPFFVAKVSENVHDDRGFNFSAPTIGRNSIRVLRALQVRNSGAYCSVFFNLFSMPEHLKPSLVLLCVQLRKPILLEGSPGVGKTSLIAAMSNMVGQEFVRINLSDQTDMMDLLGADLPVEGGAPGEFVW